MCVDIYMNIWQLVFWKVVSAALKFVVAPILIGRFLLLSASLGSLFGGERLLND